jgi:transforming growth factor-beta-induced protein
MKSLMLATTLVALVTAPLLAEETASKDKDIVDTAVAVGSFNTLVAAVQAAGLVDALKGEGPFTVFAPTDDAFAKLPKGTVEALLQDKAKLQSILKYHVVPGQVLAKDVVKLASAKTLSGVNLKIVSDKGGVSINNAKVVKTDVLCTNGVIHVVDTVLLPPTGRDSKAIVDTAISAGTFKTLAAALTAADLVDVLRGSGPFTVFAPTDEAFAKLPKGTVEALLKDKARLQKILKHHVVSGKVTAAQVAGMPSANTLAGQAVHINTCQGVKINNANVTKTDIVTSNGIIHVIDTVLIPR